MSAQGVDERMINVHYYNGQGPNTGMTPWNGKVHMRRTTGHAYTVEQGQKMNIVRTVPVSH